MKKKIAILLAAVMTATMVPATAAFANSSNNVNKVVSVKDGDFNDEVTLRIQPAETVERGDKILISIENGEFDVDDMIRENGASADADMNDMYGYKALGDEYKWDDIMALYDSKVEEFGAEQGFYQTFNDLMDDAKTVDLPYYIQRNTKREIQVELCPIHDTYAGETFAGVNKPVYRIPVPFTADGSGNVVITVDANGTSISGGQTHTIANSVSSSGDTVTSIDEIMVGSDDIELGVITIKESVQGTFKPGETVTLKLNSGFEFANRSKGMVTAGINAVFYDEDGNKLNNGFEIKSTDIDENSLTFKLPAKLAEKEKDVPTEDGKTKKPAAIKISGLWVTPEDDDNFGDVKITVSGTSAGITKETINVAERGDYGFTLKTVEDPTTIYAGRRGYDTNIDGTGYDDVKGLEYIDSKDDREGYDSYIDDKVVKGYDADDYLSATVEFAEITADSINTNRKLKFTVPDEVKIYGFEIDEEEDCSGIADGASITNDGHTLEINFGEVKDVDADEASSFELQLTLSADATYTGDVTLSVEGGGMSAGDVEDVVIAKVASPIELSTSTTKTNMGYQKVDTADIVITEAEDEMFVKDGEVRIAIDSIYGDEELGFADEDMDYEIEGDLEISKFKVSKGVISFMVDRSSTEASKITIKNVKIGTTRSIPYGSYGLKVYGSALINNYCEEAVGKGDETTGVGASLVAEPGLGYFDDNEAIKFANYVEMITETGTLDRVVKVTIGEKTIVVDGENYEMDVAPYIQTESSSTMVPLRFVMVALGVDSENIGSFDESGKVTFDAATKTATIFYAAGTNMTTIQFTAGSNIMMVNGAPIPMENGVKAEIVDGRMFVPFRAIGTAINVNVGWDADTRTATYNG